MEAMRAAWPAGVPEQARAEALELEADGGALSSA